MITTYINRLQEFDKLCSNLELIKFKAYKYFPLTTSNNFKQELFVKFKRLKLQYQHLETKKKKLSQIIITELLSSKNSLSSTDLSKLIDYQTQISTIINSHHPTNPKNIMELINLISETNITKLKILNNKSLSLMFNNYLVYFEISKKNYIKKELFDNREFRFDLMEFSYEGEYFNESEKNLYIKYLVYKHSKKLVTNITINNVRHVDSRATNNGLSTICYFLNIDNINECFIVYKGTEGEMNSQITSFNKRLDSYITESFNDWKYNINSMLLGLSDTNDQLAVARKFTKDIINNLTNRKNINIYGLGHSLGGHLVQTLQVLDNPFDFGYTLNSAPINLKQIYSLDPQLHDSITWEELFNLTYYNTQNLDTDLKIRSLLKHSYTEIKNEWFQKDLTRIYFAFPYTIYVGSTNFLDTSQWYYPFESNITGYLKDEDIKVYQDFFAGIIASTKNSKNGIFITISILNFISSQIITLYKNINSKKTRRVFIDFANYFYASKIFNKKPHLSDFENVPKKIPYWISFRKLKSEIPFLRSINMEMINTVIFFHTIAGSRFLK